MSRSAALSGCAREPPLERDNRSPDDCRAGRVRADREAPRGAAGVESRTFRRMIADGGCAGLGGFCAGRSESWVEVWRFGAVVEVFGGGLSSEE